MTLADGATLRLIFSGPGWNSTISFDSNVIFNLSGTLSLGLADGIDPNDLFGSTYQLFSWPTGFDPNTTTFASIDDNGWDWDVTNLYTTGEVTLNGLSTVITMPPPDDTPSVPDAGGTIPEPATLSMLVLGGAVILRGRRKV